MNKPMTKDELEARYEAVVRKQAGVGAYRNDGFVNLLTKYGTNRDANEHYQFVPEVTVPDDMLTAFYEGNGLFARIIDAPADEAIKHGFTIKNLSDQDVEEYYADICDELGLEEVMSTGVKWARLFGGAIGVMLIDDGRGIDEPLDWKNIRSIDGIRVYERAIVQPDYKSMFHYEHIDPFALKNNRFGTPEYYYVTSQYGSFAVHESRCLVFRNGILPENTTNSIYQVWGIPEYIRIHRAIRDAETAHGSANKMLDRSVQAVYKMQNLSEELATEQGEDRVLKRLSTIDMARGLLNSIVIDAEGEDYDFRQFTFSGVSDVIDSACNFLSALTSIPQTILFGRSPAGMNSTGESDMENWYSFVLKTNIRYLLSVIFQAGLNNGEIDEVPPIKIEFNPLWEMSDSEKANYESLIASTQSTRAQTATAYISAGVLDPSEVRKALADSAEFDIETMLDEYSDEELYPENLEMGDEDVPSQIGENLPAKTPEQQITTQQTEENVANDQFSASNAEVDAAYEQVVDMETAEMLSNAEDDHEDAHSDDDIDATYEAVVDMETAQSIDDSFEEDSVTEFEAPVDAQHHGVGILVIKDGQILLGERIKGNDAGKLAGPGGHIHIGETPLMGAIRESDEEFGIIPTELYYIGRPRMARTNPINSFAQTLMAKLSARTVRWAVPDSSLHAGCSRTKTSCLARSYTQSRWLWRS